MNLYLNEIKEIEKLIQLIPENTVTEFHLRDVFDEECKGSLEKRIKELVIRVENYKKTGKIEKKQEKTKIYSKENTEDILISLGLEKYVETFKKNNALLPEIFYGLTSDDLEKNFQVELVGKRMKLMKVINEFNAKKD